MTFDPTQENNSPESPISGSFPILEDVFYLGYTQSDPITLFKDEAKKVELTVQFRTLTPIEHRDIFTAMGKYETYMAQEVTRKLETLSRAVKLINGMPLLLPNNEIKEFYDKAERNPTPLEQAQIIFTQKIKSPDLLDLMYEAYVEFTEKVSKEFEDIKKKLKSQKSSEST